MARNGEDFAAPVRRVLIAVLVLALLAMFLVWRIDGPRAERVRTAFVDRFIPGFEWALVPVARATDMLTSFQSYSRLYQQNQELRRELQQMQAWKEAAVQLEQENSRLLALNNVQIDPALTAVTGVVMADSGTAFRQSLLLNIGARDGVVDGWAAMDGLGLVGRISGVGERVSRVMLLTDPSSRLPVTIQPSGHHALMTGDNSPYPALDFIERPEDIRPGDRVMSSGDGGVFPSGLQVGQVALATDGRLRVRLAADYGRLEFLRVLRSRAAAVPSDTGGVIAPAMHDFIGPMPPDAAAPSPDPSPDPSADPAAAAAAPAR